MVTGSGEPTCSFVYKMVARATDENPDSPLVPVAKRSAHKSTVGGRKYAVRRRDDEGIAQAEIVGVDTPVATAGLDRDLLVDLVKDGQIVGAEPLARARERHRRSVEELPMSGRRISRGEQAIPTVMVHGEGPDAVLGASLE